VAAVAVARPAHADGDADVLLKQGVELRKEGRDEEALDLFARAYRMAPSPAALALTGLAEQALGRFVVAESHLREALGAKGDPWIEENRAPLQAALNVVAGHLAAIEVVSNVVGAELWINSVRAGSLPLPAASVEAGTVVLEVRAPGYEVGRRSIEVRAGAQFREEVNLVLLRPIAAGGPLSGIRPVDREPVPSAGDARHTIAWSLIAAGGALLGAGIAAQVVREDAVEVYNDNALCFYGGLTRDQRCGRYRSRGDAAQGWAIAGYASAATSLGLGAFLLAGERSRTAGSSPRVTASCGVSGVWSFACVTSF
jgi:hypothetical protein